MVYTRIAMFSFVALILLTACHLSPQTVFTLYKPDGTAMPFTPADIQALPSTRIMAEGQPEEGPSLLDVLAAAQLTTFDTVTLRGRDGVISFAQTELTPDLILDITQRGTVKIVSPTIPREARVRDIHTIEVQ